MTSLPPAITKYLDQFLAALRSSAKLGNSFVENVNDLSYSFQTGNHSLPACDSLQD